MRIKRSPVPGGAVIALSLLVACGPTADVRASIQAQVPPPEATSEPGDATPASTSATTPQTAAASPAPVSDAAAPPSPTVSPSPRPRAVADSAFAPFAAVGGITLHHPATRVEMIGFHESNHDGARQLDVFVTAVAPAVLPTRDRETGDRTAADVVVHPESEIRAPVTGTVKRAGTYVLYCEHSDDFAVIAPDARPEWEVKILHIDGVRVRAGDRVEAGVTVLAGRPTPLPFESQVDEFTAEPSWPHVHLEVVDPSIPDRPSPGGGC